MEALTTMIQFSFPRLVLGLLLVQLMTACGQSAEQATKPAGTPVSITGYNYTIEGIQEFYVNGAWGSNLGIADGGSMVCCVQLPDKWTPGLSAKISWRRSDCGGTGPGNARCPIGGDVWHFKNLETMVPIEPYERPNDLQVMFLPGDEIKLYAVPFDPDHPEHPAKLGRPHPIGHPEWKP